MSNHTMHDLYQNILFEYISGALDDAQNFAVRTHLGLSPAHALLSGITMRWARQ